MTMLLKIKFTVRLSANTLLRQLNKVMSNYGKHSINGANENYNHDIRLEKSVINNKLYGSVHLTINL